jgi:hypothetical protein
VVLVTTAVEDNCFDTGSLRTLGNELANALGLGGLVAFECTKVGFQSGRARYGQALGVIDNLDEYVACGTVDDQTRTNSRTGDALADTKLAAAARSRLALVRTLLIN